MEPCDTNAALEAELQQVRAELERHKGELQALLEFGRTVAATLDLREIYHAMCREIAEKLLGSRNVAVSLFDQQTQCIRCVFILVEGEERSTEGMRSFPLGTGPVSATIRTAHPRIVDRGRVQPDSAPAWQAYLVGDEREPRTLLYVPMVAGDEVIGVISIQRYEANAFRETDLDLVGTLASQAAMAIRNAQLYEQARAHAEELERQGVERRQLEDQLLQSQKMEAIGQLAGGVAHDFNNMLAVILGFGELAREEQQRLGADSEALDQILKAAKRAASLTRQLLAFSRKQVLEPRPTDLNALVTDMERMLRRLIGENIELCTILQPGIRAVLADPGQIEQVLLNLAVNGRDAMPAGGRLTIETGATELDEDAARRADLPPGPHLLVSVSDTGMGMDAATLSHIFEPFFTTKEKGRGTGLGLSTVYGIVRQSGGAIRVASVPGHGTNFRVYLPQSREAPVPAAEAPAASVAIAAAHTILVVEDEDQLRGLIQKLLTAAGYRVLSAGSGAEALETSRQVAGKLDLLLTDVIMPQMGGRELAERLGALHPGLRVLYMSGYTDGGIDELETGTGFLQKPFEPSVLLEKLREVLHSAG